MAAAVSSAATTPTDRAIDVEAPGKAGVPSRNENGNSGNSGNGNGNGNSGNSGNGNGNGNSGNNGNGNGNGNSGNSGNGNGNGNRSEEHTAELQSLMRISYADVGSKTKKQRKNQNEYQHIRNQTTSTSA